MEYIYNGVHLLFRISPSRLTLLTSYPGLCNLAPPLAHEQRSWGLAIAAFQCAIPSFAGGLICGDCIVDTGMGIQTALGVGMGMRAGICLYIQSNIVIFAWEVPMKYLLKNAQRVGFVSTLLIGGVLGGLMTPLSSEAGNPTLTIDGIAVSLQQGGPGCGNDTGFINGSNSVINSCYSIVGTNTTTDSTRSQTLRVGNWYVGDYTSTNQARVLINDTSTGTDNMKLTGVTFTSAIHTSTSTTVVSATSPCSSCQVGHAVLKNTMSNAPNGTGSGADYTWGMSAGGYFDPPNTENVVNNRFRLIGTGCFSSSCTTDASFTVSLGTTLNTGTFASSTSPGINGGVSRSNAAAIRQAGCNTGNGKCAPTVKYDYEITVQGVDALTLTDSVDGCGGQCNRFQATTKLPYCPDLIADCDAQISGYHNANLTKIIEDGGVISETCTETCIIIDLKGTPANKAAGVPFDFTATGQGVENFSRTLDNQGNATKALSPLVADTNPAAGGRFFTIPAYPQKPDGTFWETDQILCSSSLNDGSATWTVGVNGNNSSEKISLTVLTIAANDILTCSWHVH